MKTKHIVFSALRTAELAEIEIPDTLAATALLVKAEYSVISAGTELANFLNKANTVVADNGFPHRPGYSASGRVLAVGSEVQDLRPGDRVALHWCGHRAKYVVQQNQVIKIADDAIEMQEAAFMHISSFPFGGLRKLNVQMGESVLIAGQGLLGIIATQLARLSGAVPVIAADLNPERRRLALALGADYAFSPDDADFSEKVLAVTDGKGVNAVVEVTGIAKALHQALDCVALYGRISLLGCTRELGEPLNFYKYVHKRGITLVGAHTMARPRFESHPGWWTERDDYHTFLKYLATGRIKIKPLISAVHDPCNVNAVYNDLVERQNPPLGVLFDWRNIE